MHVAVHAVLLRQIFEPSPVIAFSRERELQFRPACQQPRSAVIKVSIPL